jgi:hypothetical protein
VVKPVRQAKKKQFVLNQDIPDKVASDRPKKFSSAYESNHVTTDSCKPICVSHQPLIKLNGKINNISATFLVDCGSSGNFISSSFIEKHKLDVSSLDEVQSVILADGTVQSSAKRTQDVKVVIGEYEDELGFLQLPLKSYDCLLGMPWLVKCNPTVDWEGRVIRFKYNDKDVVLSDKRSFSTSKTRSSKVSQVSCGKVTDSVVIDEKVLIGSVSSNDKSVVINSVSNNDRSAVINTVSSDCNKCVVVNQVSVKHGSKPVHKFEVVSSKRMNKELRRLGKTDECVISTTYLFKT